MDEKQVREISSAAVNIIEALSDVQQTVLFHPETSANQDFRTDVYQRLSGIKNVAACLVCRQPGLAAVQEPLEKLSIQLTNALNSIKCAAESNVLQGGIEQMAAGRLMIIVMLAGLIRDTGQELICLKQQIEGRKNVAA